MSIDFIDRSRDEEIINILNSILSNADFTVETINESILVKLMELRGTPIKNYKTVRNIEQDFNNWNRTKIQISEIIKLKNRLLEINQLDLNDIDFIDDSGKPLQIDKKLIADFKFTGLSNADFISYEIYKHGIDDE